MRLSSLLARGAVLVFLGVALFSTAVQATPTPVSWLSANGTETSGAVLSRTTGSGYSDTVAGSSAIVSGTGYLEFGTAETNRDKAAGLGAANQNRGLEAIDFGFHLAANGTAWIVEKGVAVQSVGAYAASDFFRVAIEGTAVVFRVNGSLVRTSALPFSYPLLAQATLGDAGATISNAAIEGATATAVAWAGEVKAKGSAGLLSKTSTAVAWDAGAISTRGLGPGDGYLEVSASVSPNVAMVGLSHGDSNAGYSDIDYALYMSSGTLYIYEGGLNRGSFGSIAATDKLRVSIESGTVTYRRNGTLIYTSAVAPTYPLLVDSSLHSSGARVAGAVVSGNLVQVAVGKPTLSLGSGLYQTSQTVTITGEAGSTLHYTTSGMEPTESDPTIPSGSSLAVSADTHLKVKAWAPGLEPSSTAEAWYAFGTATSETVEWTAQVNTSSNGNTLSKSTGVVGWNAGAVSTSGLGSPDGYFEVSAALSPNVAMVGLSNGDTNAGYSDIDYALYFSSGTLYVYEAGTNRGSFGPVVAADKLRVSVEGGVVRYRKNGSLLYTSAIAPTFPLLVDSSLNSSGATLQGASISGVLVQAAVQNPTLSFPSGIYDTPFEVEVTGPSGAVIHYTTNGSDPTEGDPVVASGGTVSISATTTLKARAYESGLFPSGVAAAIYQFGTVSTENVVWTDQVNTTSSGNTLSKATSAVAWDASAISTRGIISPGGYLEVSASLSPNVVMVGLANGNTNSGYSDIDYALYMSSGTLYIYEGGVNRGSFGALSAADKLRVSVENGVVKYRKNGALVYTSALAPSYPLLVDTSLSSSGASITGAVISGNLVQVAVSNPAFSVGSGLYSTAQEVTITGEPGSTIHYTTDGSDPTESDGVIASGASVNVASDTVLKAKAWATGLYPSGVTAATYTFGSANTEDVVWTAQVNTSSTGNTLFKTTGVVAWDAAAISTHALASPEGYFEVSAALSPNVAMVGLSNGNTNAVYSDIDYALYFSSGTLYIYEGGLNRGSFGAVVATDKLRVSVEGGVVKYRKNGNLLYTSAIAPTLPLLVDSSLSSSGATLTGAKISGALVPVAVSRPTLTPGSGLYGADQDVTITAEAGSTIHYTLDGLEPTESDAVVASGSAVTVDADATLKAKAWTSGLIPSGTTAAIYRFGTPTTEDVAWTALVNASANGSTLSKTNGTTAWDASAVSSKAIDSPDGYLEITASLSPRVAMAGLAYGNTNSGYSDIDYALHMASGTLYVYEAGVNRGSFGALAANDKLRVSLEGGVVKYRKNGTLFYTSAIAPKYPLLVDTSLNSTTAVIQGAILSGLLVAAKTSAPVATPPAGGYALPIDVALSADPGATITYTTDGSDPTSASTAYSTPIHVTAATAIKARAFKAGYLDSDVSSHAYFLNAPGAEPTFAPGPGAYLGPLTVVATTSTPGGLIHYTLNGVDPTEADPFVSSGGGIPIPGSAVLKAVTYASGYTPSAVVAGAYQVVTPAPTISPAPGTYTTSVNVSIGAIPGAAIYYTTDGQDPTLGSTLYTGPFQLTETGTVKARALYPGWTLSATAMESYEVQLADPVLVPASGTWFAQHTIQVTTAAAGATVHYTMDGTEPTENSPVAIGGEILLSRPTSLKVRAFKVGTIDSGVTRGSYLITGQMAGGDIHTVFLKTDGTVWTVGRDDSGQIGDGSPATQRLTPVQVMTGAIQIAAGQASSYALKSDGTVWAWGANGSGQLGNGTTTTAFSPVQVTGLSGVIAIAAGASHGLALLADGTVRSWGLGSGGQLGRNSTASSSTPVTVTGLTGVKALAAGTAHSLALTTNGAIVGWGANNVGQLGDGTSTPRLLPVTLPTLVATAIATRGDASYGILASGRILVAWGGNSQGQLGDGTTTNRLQPATIKDGVREIAPGALHFAFESFDGRLWGMGQNTSRQLGDGSMSNRLRPIRSVMSKSVVTMGSGAGFSIAGVSTGDVWVAGQNQFGVLGLGNTVSPALPMMMPSFTLFSGAGLDQDLDGDGLDLYQEILLGTDPLMVDSNGNGLSDGDEFALEFEGGDPDSDQDGLSNAAELLAGTDPFKSDTDGDGVPDGADAFPLDPTKSQLVAQPGDHTPPTITLLRPISANLIP